MSQSVEPFDPARHQRVRFSSGASAIDNYLKLTARKHQAANIAAVFVIADEADEIIGYYALKAAQIDASELGGAVDAKLVARHSEVPATLLSMLGVDQSFQGRGIGRMLLADALRRSLSASKLVASQCIVLDDADSARRAAFYAALGFAPCTVSGKARMYLTMKDVAASLSQDGSL